MILVTGGDGTLAQAVKTCFETAGHQVAAPGRRSLDVRDSASIEAFLRQVPEPIDLLVNQAGGLQDGPLLTMTEGAWDSVVNTHLKGTWQVSKAYFATLQGRPGHLLQIGSFAGLSGPAGQANYAAAKAGLIGLTQSLAREWGRFSVRANVVLPGFLETSMTEGLTPTQRERFRAQHVLDSFNTVGHVAKFIRFLHEEMPHVSGQVFQLDSRVRRPGW